MYYYHTRFIFNEKCYILIFNKTQKYIIEPEQLLDITDPLNKN